MSRYAALLPATLTQHKPRTENILLHSLLYCILPGWTGFVVWSCIYHGRARTSIRHFPILIFNQTHQIRHFLIRQISIYKLPFANYTFLHSQLDIFPLRVRHFVHSQLDIFLVPISNFPISSKTFLNFSIAFDISLFPIRHLIISN